MSSSPIIIHTGSADFGLDALSPDLDREFAAFYKAVAAGFQPDTVGFDKAAAEYFDERGDTPGEIDRFFFNFTPWWSGLIAGRCFPDAGEVWKWALRPALEWEGHSNRRLHKGAAYYFAAMTAILAKDLDGGYLLAHRAFAEDVQTHGTASPITPAFALVVMDSQNVHQAFREWVAAKASWVSTALEEYRVRHSKALTFRAFHAKFLLQADLREEVFLFSYSVARLLRLAELDPVTRSSDFAAQMGANLLFDLTLVIDAVIKNADPTHWRFIELANTLASRAGLGLSQNRLAEINGRFSADFDGTAAHCLDGTMALADGSSVKGLAATLALTYGCRNRGAHNVSAIAVIRERFDEVCIALLETLFLAVEELH